MPVAPADKRCVAFVDGQNLFHAAKAAFGYTYPNYDPHALAQAICTSKSWHLVETRFYSGIPDAAIDASRHGFWVKKLAYLGSRGIILYTRAMKYKPRTVKLPDGTQQTTFLGREKGIDVRLALDVVRKARMNEFDVALIFSQDQDLSEAADEVKAISIAEGRWIQLASAFPVSPLTANQRGINGTSWIKIDLAMYDACRDPNKYIP